MRIADSSSREAAPFRLRSRSPSRRQPISCSILFQMRASKPETTQTNPHVAPDGPAGRRGRSLHQQISRSFGRAAFSIRTWDLLQPRRTEEFASEPNGVSRSRLDQSGSRRHQHRKTRYRRDDIPLCARSCVDSGASTIGTEGLGESRAGSQPIKGRRLHPARRELSRPRREFRVRARTGRFLYPCRSQPVSTPIENPCLRSVCALSRASRISTLRAKGSFSWSTGIFEPLDETAPVAK